MLRAQKLGGDIQIGVDRIFLPSVFFEELRKLRVAFSNHRQEMETPRFPIVVFVGEPVETTETIARPIGSEKTRWSALAQLAAAAGQL